MDSVREIALTFCSTAVFTSALCLINGKALEKSGRYIISLILICSVIGAVAKGDFEFSLPSAEAVTQGADTAEAICKYQAEYLVAEVLKENEIVFQNISAKATKNEDGSIIINEIEVEGVQEQEKTLKTLEEQGIDCRVIFR